jgi:hypothetical protein
VARRRAQWLRYRHRIDISRLVFIDETWTNLMPLRGWARRGQPLKGQGAASPSMAKRFRLYVEKMLLPTLRPSDIVVMDKNASRRRPQEVKRTKGVRWPWPPEPGHSRRAQRSRDPILCPHAIAREGIRNCP